jgi:glycosyltransferase involved in cell wall biosynthesis
MQTTGSMETPDREAEAHSEQAPRVSVTMPFLDPAEAFITEAVESVLGQSFQDWELLLVNDGSGPEALAVAHRLAARDARIRCISHEGGINLGIPATRNLGILHARGELLAFIDSDDTWYPHKLEEQVRLLDAAPQVDMIFGRSLYWRAWLDGADARDRPPSLLVRDRTALGPGEFLHKILQARVMVPCPTNILVRADSARAVGGFQADISNLYEDQAFYAKLSLSGVVLACAEVWDRYRLHASSVMSSATRHQAAAARRQFLDWLGTYIDGIDYDTRALRRTIRTERWAADFAYGPRLLRSTRKLAALPERLLHYRQADRATADSER